MNPHSPASIAPIFEGPINADPALSRRELVCDRVLMTMVGGKVVMATGALSGLLGPEQRALNDKVRVLSQRGSAGRAGPTHAGTRGSGDGHGH